MRALSRRAALAGAGAAALAAAGARIAWLNATFPFVPERTFRVGEWLPMGDDYLFAETDQTDGYEMMVHGAEVMTPNGFLAAYAQDKTKSTDLLGADNRCVIAVDMTVRNTNADEDGGIDAFQWQVARDGGNALYAFDTELSGHVKEVLSDGMFAIRHQDSKRFVCAFSDMEVVGRNAEGDVRRRATITEHGTYRLAMTVRPTRKVFRFEL